METNRLVQRTIVAAERAKSEGFINTYEALSNIAAQLRNDLDMNSSTVGIERDSKLFRGETA